MAYPVLADVKTFLGILDNDDDTYLNLVLSWTEELIHAYLGRNLNSATYTDDYYKPVTELILLTNFPVDSITSITIDTESKTVSDFDLVNATGEIYGDFKTGDKVEIIYVGGYAVLPGIVEDVFYGIVEDRYKDHKGTSDAEVKDVTLFDFAKVSYDTATGTGGRSLTYTGVGSTGNVPGPLENYLGMLDFYKSDKAVLSV